MIGYSALIIVIVPIVFMFIAVGTPLSGRPPRRSRRAVFPHRALRFELSLLPHQASIAAGRHRVSGCIPPLSTMLVIRAAYHHGLSYPFAVQMWNASAPVAATISPK